MKPSKLVMTLLLLVGTSSALPYIGIDSNFYINYTGMCPDCEPSVAFTCITDSLNLDSLLLLYPTVVTMDSIAYYQFIEMKMEEE